MKLIIQRPQDDVNLRRNYKILLNSKVLGYISAGETQEYDIEENGYMQLKIDSFTGSNKVEITESECSFIVTGDKALSRSPIILAILFVSISVMSISNISNVMVILLGAISISYLILLSIFKNKWLKLRVILGQ